jgi:hypothetical protein
MVKLEFEGQNFHVMVMLQEAIDSLKGCCVISLRGFSLEDKRVGSQRITLHLS